MFGIFIVSYDFGTASDEHVILPNGHCTYAAQLDYDTIKMFYIITPLNKTIQMLLFASYFIYYYKHKNLQFITSQMSCFIR